MKKFNSRDALEALGIPTPNRYEAFLEDIDDDTWGSVIYSRELNQFSIYLDGRIEAQKQGFADYHMAVTCIKVDADTLFAALKDAQANAVPA